MTRSPRHLTSPHLTAFHLSPHVTSPHLTSRHLTSPRLTPPHVRSHFPSPHLPSPHLKRNSFLLCAQRAVLCCVVACALCILRSFFFDRSAQTDVEPTIPAAQPTQRGHGKPVETATAATASQEMQREQSGKMTHPSQKTPAKNRSSNRSTQTSNGMKPPLAQNVAFLINYITINYSFSY